MPQEAINRIIKERNKKAQSFEELKLKYEKRSNVVSEIMKQKEEAINYYLAHKEEKGSEVVKAFIDSLQNVDDSNFQAKRKKLDNSIRELVHRYSKEEINISVVGYRRNGKSMLLQTISGLGSDVIPSADHEDCTGAVSVIHNNSNMEKGEKKVIITFYSPDEIIDIVNQYIYTIFEGRKRRVVSLEDIKRLKDEICSFRCEDEVRAIGKVEITRLYNKLKMYIEHYDEWSEPIKNTRNNVNEVKELSDRDDTIAEYVAQRNGKSGYEERLYYKFLAVKSADITCKFGFERCGSIVLRDTIGIGDMSALNLDAAMIQSVSENCDAAIVVKLPSDVGGDFDTRDKDVYDILRDTCTKMKLDMGKWIFYAINHRDPHGDGGNIAQCETVLNQITVRDRIPCAGAYIVNASKKDEVTDKLLKPMLNTLIQNLPSLDNDIEERIKAEEEEMNVAYERLLTMCRIASDVNINDVKCGIESNIAEDMLNSLRSSLLAIERDYSDRNSKECEEFKASIIALSPYTGKNCEIIPSFDTILVSLNSNQVPNIYMQYLMDKVRMEFTKKFIEINDVLNDLVYSMKAKICRALIVNGELHKLICKVPEDFAKVLQEKIDYVKGEEYDAWLKAVANKISVMFKANGHRYVHIVTALEFLANFNISVRSFVMQHVRNNLIELEPRVQIPGRTSPASVIMSMEGPGYTNEDRAAAIFELLSNAYAGAFRDVTFSIDSAGLYSTPNDLICAAVTDFCDRLLRSQNFLGHTVETIEYVWRDMFRSGKIFNAELIETTEKCKNLQDAFKNLVK